MSLTGEYRNKTVRVAKYTAGVLQAGYPKYYRMSGGGTTFTYNGSAVTEAILAGFQTGSIGHVGTYLDCLDEFRTWVETAEAGTTDLILTEINDPYGEDATSCPIGEYANDFIFSTGYNINGELAIGDNISVNVLEAPSAVRESKAIAAGSNHSIHISSAGVIYTSGLNDEYQLGDGSTTAQNTPTALAGGTVWQMVAAGDSTPQQLTKTDFFTLGDVVLKGSVVMERSRQ